GSAPTDSSGVATLTGISLSGFRGGTSAGTIVANFAGDANYLGSSITGGLGVWPSATTTTIAADVSVAYSKSIQSVQITALVTSSSGTVVNEGYVLFNVDDFVCGNFGYAPVVNGQATNNCIVPANLVGNYVIDAHYEGYAQDFLPSEDATPHHHLNIIALYSDLEVVSFSIPPQSQSSNPNILTFVATVINHGPDPASVVQVDLDYYDTNGVLKNFANQITTNVPVNIPVTLSASIDWSSQEQLTPFPPQPTLVANAWSTTSIDVNGANNQKSLVLNGFYRMLTTNAATFEVDNNGYGFRNNLGQVDWSLYEDVFSKDAVEWNTPNGVVDKLAEWSFYAAVFVPGIEGGNCYGMSATSLRFYKGADDFHNYEPSATSVYAMQTNYALNDPVWHNIEKYQGYQFGSEIQGAFSAQSNDPVTTLNTVKDAMSLDGYSGVNKDPVILSMFGPKYAHAVVPYRIIETTTSDGAHVADIYIYDSNFKGDSQQVVSVDVTADTYSSAYSNTVFKFGGNTGLVATASALNDTPPSLPFSTPGVDILIVGGTANMLTTDNVGRSLGYQNGNLVEQIPGGRLIRPFLDSSTTSTFPEAYILPTGQYVTTLYGNNTGTATANFILSPSLSTSTSNSIVSLLTFTSYTMTPTTQDTIIFSQDGNTVTLGTNAASEHYSNTLSHEISNSARSYTVSNTTISSGETITMEVINGGASFGIVNQGEPKTYDLTLTQVGAGAGTTSFTGVTIGAGESQIFTPSDWNNLSTTEVDWQVKNSQGKIVTTEALQIAFKDVQRNTQLTINTLDKQFRFLATNFDSGLINAPEMKVINIDPSNPDPALRYNAKTKTWSLDPSKLGAAQQAQALLSQQTFTVLPKELIVIPYEDNNIVFFAVASVNSNKEKCFAFLLQKSTGKIYLLII
ncbi:MAG TPA: hypothetical protein VLX29_05285, partial [Nitrospirota bacterium]|nr:hypothetical protein [Nitrospirota bacterium]